VLVPIARRSASRNGNRFLSPQLVTELLEHTGRLIEAMWGAADLDAVSEGVWRAGIDPAPT